MEGRLSEGCCGRGLPRRGAGSIGSPQKMVPSAKYSSQDQQPGPVLLSDHRGVFLIAHAALGLWAHFVWKAGGGRLGWLGRAMDDADDEKHACL